MKKIILCAFGSLLFVNAYGAGQIGGINVTAQQLTYDRSYDYSLPGVTGKNDLESKANLIGLDLKQSLNNNWTLLLAGTKSFDFTDVEVEQTYSAGSNYTHKDGDTSFTDYSLGLKQHITSWFTADYTLSRAIFDHESDVNAAANDSEFKYKETMDSANVDFVVNVPLVKDIILGASLGAAYNIHDVKSSFSDDDGGFEEVKINFKAHTVSYRARAWAKLKLANGTGISLNYSAEKYNELDVKDEEFLDSTNGYAATDGFKIDKFKGTTNKVYAMIGYYY